MPDVRKSARRAVLATVLAAMVVVPSAAQSVEDSPLVPLTPEALSGPALIFHCGKEFVTAGTAAAVDSFRKTDVLRLSYNAAGNSGNFRVHTEGLRVYDLPLAMLSDLVRCLD